MFCRGICCFICTYLAVATATGYSGQDSNTDSSTLGPDQEVRPITAVDLGALLDAGEGAVVTLVAGDTRLAAHRAVLSARSAVFQRILQDEAIGEVAVPDVEGPVLRQLLAYLYTLQAPQLPAMAPQLLAAAHQYGLPALKADCEQQVAEQLTVETAVATAVLAVRHSCDTLREASIDYIRTHIFHVMATQGWADAINSQPEVMIRVMQLLSQSPAESSSSAPAESDSSPYHATQPHSDCSGHQTPTTAAPTTVTQTITQTDDDHVTLLRSTAHAGSETSPYPAAQQHSNHSGHHTPATSMPTLAGQTMRETDGDGISYLGSTAHAGSETSLYPATQQHRNHSGHHTPATAMPTFAGQTMSETDDDDFSYFWSFSPEEKTRWLMEAAKEGAVGELEALLAAGADVGARDWGNATALHRAALRGREEAARRLLAAGAAVDDRDNGQWTPLHSAALWGHAAVVRLLLENGADHGARTESRRTPLHLAAYEGHREAAAALLEAGADRAATDNWGDTPLDDARRNNHQQVVELLQRQ